MPPPTRGRTGSRKSRIPAGRIERLARIGWMAGEIALGGLAEGARRLTGNGKQADNVLVTAANARRLARRLSGMRGAVMKLGQLISLEGDDLLPPEVAEALSILRSDADAMPEAQLRRVLGQAYHKGWEKRFREFLSEPIAAASIGQVHYAVAADGRHLALKVQYPGVARSIDSDVDNLASALRLSRILPRDFDISQLLAEAKRQLHQETDYRIEAGHLRRYRALVADEPGVVVPQVYDDLTTAHVLAMDYLSGVPLEELVRGDHKAETRDRIGALLYRLLFREMFEFHYMQTDPNFANYLWLSETRQVGLLDFGAARDVPAALANQYRQLFHAGAREDRSRMREAMHAIGFFTEEDGRERIDGLIDLFLIGCEPFRHRGVYDFAASDLPARARTAGQDLTSKKGFLRPPPAEVLFLHRKLGGTFLLCARLGARFDVATLVKPFLQGKEGSR